MQEFTGIARLLIFAGIFLLVAGLILLLLSKFNMPLFKLPGDIYIKKDNFTFYFPLVSCIIFSVIISFLLNIFFRR